MSLSLKKSHLIGALERAMLFLFYVLDCVGHVTM